MRFVLPVLFCVLAGWNASFALPVEVSHPVAGFLRRLEEKGIIPLGFWNTLPRDDREIFAALRQAETRRSSLSPWDRSRLDRHLQEFDPAEKARSRLYYRDSMTTLRGSVEYFMGIYHRDSIPRADLFAFGSFTPGVDATYGRWIYLTSSGSVGMERNYHGRFQTGNFDPQNGLPYVSERVGSLDTRSTKVSTFDGFRMMIGVGDSRVHLEAGQDWNEWGPGRWQHTTLGAHPFFLVTDSLEGNPAVGYNGSRTAGSFRRGYRYPGEGPPLPQIRLRFGGRNWEYTKIIAERKGLWNDSAAKLIAHRVQVNLGSLRLGATEMLALGTRAPDIVDFLPAIPLKMTEHRRGDLDNSAMSGDVEWVWTGRGRAYVEIFMDDFSGPPLSYWGNKLAYVAGAAWQDAFGLPSEIHVEYARVDPYVYSHRLTNTALQSYMALLGSSLPPNSQAFSASVEFPLLREVTGQLEWSIRQRDLKSSGSSIFDVYDGAVDSPVKQFLVADVETRNQFFFSADGSWSRFLRVRGGAGWLWVETWRGKPGERLSTPSLFGEVTFRY